MGSLAVWPLLPSVSPPPGNGNGGPGSRSSAAATASVSTRSSSKPAGRSRTAPACCSPRPPVRARRSSGEFAAFLALRGGRKCFYTTPIKALSNQKYADLVARHGPDDVGLLTGDNSINGDAPVVVMTTEVLRNMLYAGSDTLRGLGYVVMDEVHYLADRFRGAVWEEVIIHLPDEVRLVSLSATVSNAEEFGEWLGDRPRRHRGRRGGAPAGPAVAVGAGRPTALRPVHRRRAQRGQPGPGAHRPPGRPLRPSPEPTGGATPPPQPGVGALPGRRRRGARRSRHAAGHHLHLQPQRLPAGGRPVPPVGHAAQHLRRGQGGPRPRRGAHRRAAGRGPVGARLLRVARGPRARGRGPPRRHAADVQGGRGGAVRPRPRQGRLRHRDAGARHQHAGALGRSRTAVQVERRGARRHHAGGVHPADRPGRPPRHRRRGPCRRALHARGRPQTRGGPGLHPHLPAPVELPAVVQHGRQPGRQGRPAHRPGAARVVVRAVPGRPVGRRARPAATPQRGGARRLPRGDDLRARRLRGVRRPATAAVRPGGRPGPPRRGRPARGGGRVAGAAADRRRHPSAGRPPGRAGRRPRPRPDGGPRGAAADRAHQRTPGEEADGPRLPHPRRGAEPGEGPEELQPPQPEEPSRPRVEPAQHRGRGRRRAAAPGALGRPRTTPRSIGCAQRCGPTRATAAPTARTTPAGPSAGTGCAARPTRSNAGWRAAPTPSPAPSTASAGCSSGTATSTATR